jgi:hypothetical protein
MRLRRRQPFERTSDDLLIDGYNPEDLIKESDLKDEFEMEDDPELVPPSKAKRYRTKRIKRQPSITLPSKKSIGPQLQVSNYPLKGS